MIEGSVVQIAYDQEQNRPSWRRTKCDYEEDENSAVHEGVAPASRGDPARASDRAGDRCGVTRHASGRGPGVRPDPVQPLTRRAPRRGRRLPDPAGAPPAGSGASRPGPARNADGPERVGRGVTSLRARARVRAPELHGAGGWLNTGGRPLSLADLRGRIVLLDFWTFCCVNCLHVIEELRPLEERYADVLVVVGVHSPKFPHEADHAALAAAVERYELHHPVLDDPELRTWQQYAVRAWPTLVVIDPEGYVVSVAAGEGHADGARPADRRAGHRARRPRHPAPRRRPVRAAAAAARPPCASPAVSPSRRPGRCWSPTPGTTRWSSWRRTARPCCAGSAPASAAAPTAGRTRPASPSRRASPCCPPRSPRPSATTSWSPTPSTT